MNDRNPSDIRRPDRNIRVGDNCWFNFFRKMEDSDSLSFNQIQGNYYNIIYLIFYLYYIIYYYYYYTLS